MFSSPPSVGFAVLVLTPSLSRQKTNLSTLSLLFSLHRLSAACQPQQLGSHWMGSTLPEGVSIPDDKASHMNTRHFLQYRG